MLNLIAQEPIQAAATSFAVASGPAVGPHKTSTANLCTKSLHRSPSEPLLLGAVATDCIRLTAREIEIFGWIVKGKSDWQIGEILLISHKTVNYHVERAKRKLNTGTRMQATILAIQLGLIAPPLSPLAIGNLLTGDAVDEPLE